MSEEIKEENFIEGSVAVGSKTALVSIVGRPSAGKSTFLNTCAGEKVSIVSPVPQTTRNAIRGIINTTLGQLVFVDTPGLHLSEKKLNLKLTKIASEQIEYSDSVLYVIDATRIHGEEEAMIAEMLTQFKKKIVIAINKTDDKDADVAAARDFVSEKFPGLEKGRVFEISAKDDVNVNDVLRALYDLAENAPHLYPEDFYTDQQIDFRIAEIIRGEAMNRLTQELPHALYVTVSDFRMATPNLMKVIAFIYVERESQKGIVVGKNADKIREIRLAAMKTCRQVFPYKVDIDLRVKVDKNWRQKDHVLTRLIK